MAHKRDPTGNPSVSCLFQRRSPLTVFRGISFLIVNPVDRKSILITILHCPSLERREIVPFIANTNPAPTIQLITVISLPVTTVQHPAPNGIDTVIGRFFITNSGSVFSESGRCCIFPVASTAFRFAFSERFGIHLDRFSTRTFTKPTDLFTWRLVCPFDHRQAPEPLAGQVDQLTHAVQRPCSHAQRTPSPTRPES